MPDYELTPSRLQGTLVIPSSKSLGHRAIIAAALARDSIVSNVTRSQDICATIEALRSLGAQLEYTGDAVETRSFSPTISPTIACHESGSTLRFMIPIAMAFCDRAEFSAQGRLPQRPLTPYYDIFNIKREENRILVNNQLKNGRFSLRGDISSQFVTGLLMALPLVRGDSVIEITTPLESSPYIDLTLNVLDKFGVSIANHNYKTFEILGGQHYSPASYTVEGDYSQAAFPLCANALGAKIETVGLTPHSAQGDKAIVDILKDFPTVIDCANIPDLVPILAVTAAFRNQETRLIGAGRLRIKESDRLSAISAALQKLGADIQEHPDALTIRGGRTLGGGICDSHNDHRIAMALAICATRCSGNVIITGGECVNKSWPGFWETYKKLGGKLHELGN